ncbi:hypothetical protein [Achromobacter xylosoxidans]|uniref:hypothetical protein n=3 Tax=Alcaligenes xylosoxydans xylosoxydans TaxID=85698 RepID=UPI001F12C328|nr:hypothetical protein [Achromobacter xylosoxidans]
MPATIGFGSAFPASQSVQNGQFCRRRCLFSGLLIVFGLLSGALAMAAGNFTMTIEHLDGDSTTFSIPSGAGQQTGPQTLVLKIPLPSKDGEIDKSVEASVIVRPVYSNGSSYVSQVLAGELPDTHEIAPKNGMRVFERKVKGIGTMVLYVFQGDDGVPVLVEDSGSFNHAYGFYHDVPGKYRIQSAVPKAAGDDFRFADKQVLRNVNNLIVGR